MDYIKIGLKIAPKRFLLLVYWSEDDPECYVIKQSIKLSVELFLSDLYKPFIIIVKTWSKENNGILIWQQFLGHSFGSSRHYTLSAINNIQQNFLLPSLKFLKNNGPRSAEEEDTQPAGRKIRNLVIVDPFAGESVATFDLFSVSIAMISHIGSQIKVPFYRIKNQFLVGICLNSFLWMTILTCSFNIFII